MLAHEKELILGQSGSGKTFEMIQRFKKSDRAIYFDLTNDTFNPKEPMTGVNGAIIYNDVTEFAENIYFLAQLQKFKVILKFDDVRKYEKIIDFLWLSKISNIVLFIDEIHIFAPSKKISDSLKNIIVLGRHRNLNLVIASQRPLMVNPVARSQMTKITTFRQTEKRDLQLLAEHGFDVNKVYNLNFSKHEKMTIDYSQKMHEK